MKTTIVAVILTCTLCSSFAQKIENVKVLQSEGDILLSFDLFANKSIREEYDLTVKSSYDNYSRSVSVKRGKTTKVKPIRRVSLVIDGMENFRGFKGKLDFKIEAKATYAPVNFSSPKEGVTVKRGDTLEIAWKGGIEHDTYLLLLYKNEVLNRVIKNQHTGESFKWVIPQKDQISGSGFQIKIEPSINRIESVLSEKFKIK